MDPQLEKLLAAAEAQRRRVEKIVTILGGVSASGRVYPEAVIELSDLVPAALAYAEKVSNDMSAVWLNALDTRIDLFSEVASAPENKQLAAAVHMCGVAKALLDVKRIGDSWDDITCSAGAALIDG